MVRIRVCMYRIIIGCPHTQVYGQAYILDGRKHIWLGLGYVCIGLGYVYIGCPHPQVYGQAYTLDGRKRRGVSFCVR